MVLGFSEFSGRDSHGSLDSRLGATGSPRAGGLDRRGSGY